MKARPLFLCLLSAALGAIPALAQDEAKPVAPKADKSGQMEKRRQEMLKRFDLDGDGKLDDTEKAAMKEAQKQEKAVRGSGDIGSLSAGEPGGPGYGDGKMDRFRQELMKRFDKNGDGKLDDAERADMEAARKAVEQNGGLAKFREQAIKQFDRNHDGVIDESERAEAEKFRDDQIKRFDKNGDGRLDQDERAEAIRAYLADHPELVPARGN